jgi:hypothetical protein
LGPWDHEDTLRLILGYALLEDLALWVVLAFATALATSATLAQQHVTSTVSSHVIGTLIYTLIGLFLAPGLLKRLSNANRNVLYKASPVGYAMAVLMMYCAIAAIFEVNLQFAALLAGYGIVGGLYGTQRERFSTPIDAISKVSFGVFVPIYQSGRKAPVLQGGDIRPVKAGSFVAVHLDELRLEVSANFLEHDFEPLDSVSVKYLSSIFGDEYQVDHAMRIRNACRDEYHLTIAWTNNDQ